MAGEGTCLSSGSRPQASRGCSALHHVWKNAGLAKLDPRRARRIPRVVFKIARDQRGHVLLTKRQQRGHVQPMMHRRERRDVSPSQLKQPCRRPQPPSVLRMPGPQKLLLQMDERSCDLDQSLEKRAVRIVCPQPELFEHIVRFVVFAAIEADEKARVVRVEVEVRRGAERLDEGGNAITFFHNAKSRPKCNTGILAGGRRKSRFVGESGRRMAVNCRQLNGEERSVLAVLRVEGVGELAAEDGAAEAI